jgi:DNA mismatch repair protein MSH5
MIAFPESPRWRAEGMLPDDFEPVFTEEKTYFKNEDMRLLDRNIGDLDAYIKDTETLLVAELEDDILDSETELRETFNALADLDCILSFASCAADLNCVRPEVVPAAEHCIFITRGRHPLQELIIDTPFVPNDTDVDVSRRVNLITGPNFSGKSCYARQGKQQLS